jgi:methionyl-tRNA synthetase
MLKVIGLPLPKKLLVHGWWQKDGQKLSKSTGVVVDPVAVINEWGVDAFRYYVVRELAIGPDGNWTDASFTSRYNSELANGLGNLVNRSLSMLSKYRGGKVPERSNDLESEAKTVSSKVRACWESNELQEGLQEIWALITRANQYVDQTAPFKLAKDPTQSARLDQVLYSLVETCRVLAILLWPYIPETSEKVFSQLGLSGSATLFSSATWGGLQPGHQIGQPQALFPRRDLQKPVP